mmetsp:Transcript_3921/g.8644  ORF Transcript_3921/g.8644 Transcript_3921/m.8644 type:complete len:84 (-) Transcript_3921:140-391(-)
MTTSTKKQTTKNEQKDERVQRKQLQTVSDLLSNGDDESTQAESTMSKLLWMTFLVVMFYISLEIFLRLHRADEAEKAGGKSEL